MRPCSVVSKPMPARVMAAAIRDGSSAPERSAGRSAPGRSTVYSSHAKWSSARLRLAVRIRGEARDQPDGLALLAHAHTRRRRACASKTPPARSHTARGSGCSGIGRGVGFAYMTVPAGQRGPAQSAPNSLGLPSSQCSLSHCASAEKKVTPGFDECGSDTSEAKLAASIPFSAILMISRNLCFHES